MGRRNWIWIGLSAAILIGLILLLADRFPGKLDNAEDRTQVFYLAAILVLVGGGVLARFRAQPGSSLAQAGLWVVIFSGLILAYSFKEDFGRLGARFGGALSPSGGEAGAPGEISFPRAADGHYHVMATIDGKRIEFLVDTGASDIVLAPDDARRLGYKLDQLQFSLTAETANGTVSGAPIRLGELGIGPIVMRDIPAQVNSAEMSNSLLGMTFMNRLTSWRVENGKLTLRK